MAEQVAGGSSTDAAVVSEAFATARELLRGAEADAARLRADADRYVRQREQEAELLVAKARRLLAMAEERAASMIATPRVETPGLATTPAGVDDPGAVAVDRSVTTGLDRILASAIGKAVDQAFPPEA